MIVKNLPYCKLAFFDNYVIVEITENHVQNASSTNEILKVMQQHFRGKEFTIISNRRNKYTLADDAYTSKLFKKVRGFAVVSECPEVRESAVNEQTKFDKSFAFFEKLEEAQDWATSLITN